MSAQGLLNEWNVARRFGACEDPRIDCCRGDETVVALKQQARKKKPKKTVLISVYKLPSLALTAND